MRSKYLPWHTAGDPPKKVRCPDCPRVGAVDARIMELEHQVAQLEVDLNFANLLLRGRVRRDPCNEGD